MCKENYVSFEIAKLLKEKGFDEECRAYYVKSKECGIELFSTERSHNYNDDVYPRTSAPTLQMAMKWLREKHKIYIMIDRSFSMEDSWHYCICVNDDFDNIIQQESQPHRKYEEACEEAIRYSLENLI